MNEQITAMFCRQYNVSNQYFSELLENFYDHPYQKNKSIRIVALDGTRVVGFQSFFYWPYYLHGNRIEVYQSGNSLVDPAYRGQQIFARMLQHLDEYQKELKIDLLIGFPIQASRNSLIRNGWKNILDLQWYVSAGSFWSFFNSEDKQLRSAFKVQPDVDPKDSPEHYISLSRDNDFTAWRKDYSSAQNYHYFTFKTSSGITTFTMKSSHRKKLIRELVIGNIQSTNYERTHLIAAFQALKNAVKTHHTSAFISFAANPVCKLIPTDLVTASGFKKINKRIFFCIKNYSGRKEFDQPENWSIFRSDIDTW